MANKNERGSWKAKAVAIAALLAALGWGVVAYLDGDDTTNPDISEIIDAGQDVRDEFSDAEPEG